MDFWSNLGGIWGPKTGPSWERKMQKGIKKSTSIKNRIPEGSEVDLGAILGGSWAHVGEHLGRFLELSWLHLGAQMVSSTTASWPVRGKSENQHPESSLMPFPGQGAGMLKIDALRISWRHFLATARNC